jgi:hypothetical protein
MFPKEWLIAKVIRKRSFAKPAMKPEGAVLGQDLAQQRAALRADGCTLIGCCYRPTYAPPLDRGSRRHAVS